MNPVKTAEWRAHLAAVGWVLLFKPIGEGFMEGVREMVLQSEMLLGPQVVLVSISPAAAQILMFPCRRCQGGSNHNSFFHGLTDGDS
jgi:hypothetical protein